MNSDIYFDEANLNAELSKIRLQLSQTNFYSNFDEIFDEILKEYKTNNNAQLEKIQNVVKHKLRIINKNLENDLLIVDKAIDDFEEMQRKG